jgi:predicted protein tyrosine phosphatase
MKNKTLRIMSRGEALAHSYKVETPKYILISINCPGEQSPQFYESTNPEYVRKIDSIRLEFNDVDREFKGLEPKQKDFIGLKDFIDKYKNSDEVEEIIVHCHAGVSRSSATAIAIAKYLDNNSFIEEVLNSSLYSPNELVYRLALNEFGIEINEEEIQRYRKINENAHELVEIPKDLKDLLYIERTHELF